MGHSERRTKYGETDEDRLSFPKNGCRETKQFLWREDVAEKVSQALTAGLKVDLRRFCCLEILGAFRMLLFIYINVYIYRFIDIDTYDIPNILFVYEVSD